MMIQFIFIFFGTKNLSSIIQRSILIVLLAVIVIQNSQRNQLLKIYKTPSQYIPFSTGRAYVTNPPQWLDTVQKTTVYLQRNLEADENFFALPYDPLYYFLAQKNSPVRELNFFAHINIQEDQQREIIGHLEKKKINWIVLSSRSNSPVKGLGIFGRDYGILLNDYIKKNFKLIETFGDWQTPPRKAFERIKIFKRIQSF
jgi:hypothetical protein